MISTNPIGGSDFTTLAGLRAVCYARTACAEQSSAGTSGRLDLQLEAAHEAAAVHGFTVVRLFKDSGRPRSAFESCMTFLRSGGADALVVHSIDRIDRNLDWVLACINDLCRIGVTTVALREMLIVSHPDDMMLSTLLDPMGSIGRIGGIGRIGRVSRS